MLFHSQEQKTSCWIIYAKWQMKLDAKKSIKKGLLLNSQISLAYQWLEWISTVSRLVWKPNEGWHRHSGMIEHLPVFDFWSLLVSFPHSHLWNRSSGSVSANSCEKGCDSIQCYSQSAIVMANSLATSNRQWGEAVRDGPGRNERWIWGLVGKPPAKNNWRSLSKRGC